MVVPHLVQEKLQNNKTATFLLKFIGIFGTIFSNLTYTAELGNTDPYY